MLFYDLPLLRSRQIADTQHVRESAGSPFTIHHHLDQIQIFSRPNDFGSLSERLATNCRIEEHIIQIPPDFLNINFLIPADDREFDIRRQFFSSATSAIFAEDRKS